jgi:ATP-dependent RNA helicase DDX54/DBP10
LTLARAGGDRSRALPASQSVQRSKQLEVIGFGIHPMFMERIASEEIEKESVLKALSQYKPSQTVFEVNRRPTDKVTLVMAAKRLVDCPRSLCLPGWRAATG